MTLRILVTFPFAPGTPGGGTYDCVELARHLAREGAQVTLASVACTGRGAFPRRAEEPNELGLQRVAELAREGVTHVSVRPDPLHLRLDGRPMRRAVLDLLAREPFDAVLGYWHEAFFLPGPLHGRRVLFALNGAASFNQFLGPGSGLLRGLRNARIRAMLQSAAVVFARSEFTRGELMELAGVDPERIRVVHLGVADVFHAAQSGRVEPVRDLLFYGALTEAKGVFDALSALGQVARRGNADWMLRIAGWGDAEAVRAAARERGLAERIELLGPLEHPQLVRELERAQLAVLPSHTESFGLANAESQAAGVAVVAYGVAAVPEVVADGVSGWLVPVGQTDALADALERALGDPEGVWRAGQAGRERALERFSWQRAARRTSEGLAEAIAARSR
jgi:glycosyltransferase involved in cell wall biosynthesis